jgi:hypothetical protein
MPELVLALNLKTGQYLTNNDGAGPIQEAAVWHLGEDGLQKLVLDTLRARGYGILKVEPKPDENGYLRVAFFSEFKPVFFRIEQDEIILSDEAGQLLEKRRGDTLEASFGVLPVTYLDALWKSKGFLYKEDEDAFKKEMGCK